MNTALDSVRYGQRHKGFVADPLIQFGSWSLQLAQVGYVPGGVVVRPFHRQYKRTPTHRSLPVPPKENDSIIVPLRVAMALCVQYARMNHARVVNGNDYYEHGPECYQRWKSKGVGNCGGNHWPETKKKNRPFIKNFPLKKKFISLYY